MTSLDLARIVKLAEASRRINSQDDKHYCNPVIMMHMLEDGAFVKSLNQKQGPKSFVHTVWYQGITFTSTSDKFLHAFQQYEKKHSKK